MSNAGGLGFLAAGYKSAAAVEEDVAGLRATTDRPWGLNLFAPPAPAPDAERIAAYADALRAEGMKPGEPRHDDDGWGEKLEVAVAARPAVLSVTFGCPSAEEIARLGAADIAVWVTVTTPEEAAAAEHAGAAALVVQGVEAGGHRGSFDDAAPGEIGLLALLQLVGARSGLPLIATGGIATGRGIAAALVAGASAAQLGSAFMLCPEAGTAPAHREQLREPGTTGLTRAFTGRTARGIVNRFQREHADAPSGYPDIHHLTAPLRAAARERGDAEAINLWAGQAHSLAESVPAAELVARLAAEAREALRGV